MRQHWLGFALRWLWWIGAPIGAAIVLGYASVDIGPAWNAHTGDGATGTFTAQREVCSRRSCSWYGDFVSDDRMVQRTDVLLGSGDEPSRIGGTIRAIDTGDRTSVYPAGGGGDWILIPLVGSLGLLLLAFWVRSLKLPRSAPVR